VTEKRYVLQVPADRRAFVWREDEKDARAVAEKLQLLGFDAVLDPAGPALEVVRLRYSDGWTASVERVVFRRVLPGHPTEAHNGAADFLAGFLAGWDYMVTMASPGRRS
jgi:hypothetical protein